MDAMMQMSHTETVDILGAMEGGIGWQLVVGGNAFRYGGDFTDSYMIRGVMDGTMVPSYLASC